MDGNHFHVFVRDLAGALAWFTRVWDAEPTYRGEQMAVLQFGPILLVLDQDEEETVTTIGYATEDCDADFRRVVGRGAQVIEEPADRSWGVRVAYPGTRPHHPGTGTGAPENQRTEQRVCHLGAPASYGCTPRAGGHHAERPGISEFLSRGRLILDAVSVDP